MIVMEAALRTSLFATHQRLGAKLIPFGGYAMPLSYAGIIEEHLAVRERAGLFDLGHMGEFWLEGPDALEILERLMTNSAARLAEGRAHYTIMCAPDGGTIDDLIVYRIDADRYMLCVNASNIAADREWMLGRDARRAGFRDASAETGLVAIQGPMSVEILAPLASIPLALLRRFAVAKAEVAGVRSIVARTGYTGEDGFEIFVDAARAPRLFDAILEAGVARGLVPCGLGARDTLRMEAGLPLYDHELDRDTSPLEAGLGAFVKLGREFIGSAALENQARDGTRKRLVGLQTRDGRSIARQGYPILASGVAAGTITSGTFAPTFKRPLAMAYLNSTSARADDSSLIEVMIRERRIAADLTPLPFYRRK